MSAIICRNITIQTIYYDDDGDIMTGDDLIEMCHQYQVCNKYQYQQSLSLQSMNDQTTTPPILNLTPITSLFSKTTLRIAQTTHKP